MGDLRKIPTYFIHIGIIMNHLSIIISFIGEEITKVFIHMKCRYETQDDCNNKKIELTK